MEIETMDQNSIELLLSQRDPSDWTAAPRECEVWFLLERITNTERLVVNLESSSFNVGRK